MTSVNFLYIFFENRNRNIGRDQRICTNKGHSENCYYFCIYFILSAKRVKRRECVCVYFFGKLFRITMFFFFFVIVNSMYCVVLLLLYDLYNHFRYVF